MTIAVDAMGGDYGPSVAVPAALQILEKYPDLQLILVGDQDILRKKIETKTLCDSSRLTVLHASQQVEMDESPSLALRNKKDSSMRVAINLVKEGQAQACVSAGNTGALMAIARFVLKTIPGIDRPAIISAFPTKSGKVVRMLDLGANVDSSAENLLQFAIMGSVLISAVENVSSPKISLLNIGEEDIKGNEQVKKTAQLLQAYEAINYVGYIEADDLYSDITDVVVCDGFVGNVALKASEGVAKLIIDLIKQEFKRNWLTKIAAFISLPVMKAVIKHIDPNRYNGATFIGLQGTVIKSHGGANKAAFFHAIEEAIAQADKNVPDLINSKVEQLLKDTSRD